MLKLNSGQDLNWVSMLKMPLKLERRRLDSLALFLATTWYMISEARIIGGIQFFVIISSTFVESAFLVRYDT